MFVLKLKCEINAQYFLSGTLRKDTVILPSVQEEKKGRLREGRIFAPRPQTVRVREIRKS